MCNYGSLHLRINEILTEKGISKNKICKDLDIPRSNFNRYCRDEFQRMDTNLICKLCNYLDVDISALIEYKKPEPSHHEQNTLDSGWIHPGTRVDQEPSSIRNVRRKAHAENTVLYLQGDIFKTKKHMDPVFTRGFHSDIMTIIVEKPLPELPHN